MVECMQSHKYDTYDSSTFYEQSLCESSDYLSELLDNHTVGKDALLLHVLTLCAIGDCLIGFPCSHIMDMETSLSSDELPFYARQGNFYM